MLCLEEGKHAEHKVIRIVKELEAYESKWNSLRTNINGALLKAESKVQEVQQLLTLLEKLMF
jgi:hypothetical protein